MSFLRKHWPWIFLLLIPLIPLWRAVFLGEAIGPFDQIRQMAPWHGAKPSQPWDVLQADGVLQFYVWRDLVLEAWGKGGVPFWNPFELAGTPLLANSQSAALYPPHILMGILHVPTSLAITLLAWFHLFWAGLGVAKLAERLGASRLGGVVAGSSFSLSAFMVSWTALSSVITTVSWIPWVLFGIASLYYLPPSLAQGIDKGDVGPIRRHQWRFTALLALCVCMMILAGHLQFVAYGFVAAVFLTLGLALSRHLIVRKKGLPDNSETTAFVDWQESTGFAEVQKAVVWRVGIALVLGVLMAAPQLLPVLKYGQFSHRRNAPTAAGYEAYLGGALKPFQLANTGYALSLGNPREAVEGGDGLSTYWPALTKQGDNFAESAVALGPLILALLFLAPWKRQGAKLGPVGGIAVVALLLAFGTILNALLFYVVPGWSSTGSPGRVIVLFVMAACVIGGVALTRLPKLPEKGAARWVPLLLPAVLCAVLLALGHMAEVPSNMAEAVAAIQSAATRGAAPGLLISAVLAAAGIAMAYHLDRLSSKVVVLLVPVGIALFSGVPGLIMTGAPLGKVDGPSDPYARVAVMNDQWGLLAAAPALLPPNLAALNRIHELGGYDSLLHRDTKKLLDSVNGGQDSAPPANGNMMFVKPSFDWEALEDAGVSQVWSTKPDFGGLKGTEDGGIYKYDFSGRTDYSGRASVLGSGGGPKPAKIVEESFSQVRVEAEGPGLLTLCDRNMPGWLAKVDGKHVDLKPTGPSDVPDAWMGVDLPAGKHTVEFNYVAPGFMTGVFLGIPAWLAFLAGAFLTRRRKAA